MIVILEVPNNRDVGYFTRD